MAELDRPDNFGGIDDEFASVGDTAHKHSAQSDDSRNDDMQDIVESGDEAQLQDLVARDLPAEAEAQLDRLLSQKFGMTTSELRLRVATSIHAEQEAIEAQAAMAFLQQHPDYVRTEKNSDALLNFLGQAKLPVTPDNLDYAHYKLAQAGMLETANESRPRPTIGLSDRATTRHEYSGDPEPFDAEAFRTLLSADGRRLYAELVRRAEINGERAPSVKEFARSYKANRMD